MKSGRRLHVTAIVSGAFLSVLACGMASAAPPLENITAIAVGARHACAVTGGGVKCWGYAAGPQLGDGSLGIRIIPGYVTGLTSGVIDVSSKWNSTCALTAAGGVKCWGANESGQLGDGTTVDRLVPVDVVGLASGVVAISVGMQHACAVTMMGGLKCWGGNLSGKLGDGTTMNRSTPVDVQSLSADVVAVAAGHEATCALTVSRAVKCWGWNGSGLLGDGTTVDRITPADVSGLFTGGAAVAMGAGTACAVTTGGALRCWGDNTFGVVGDGSSVTPRPTPVNTWGFLGGITSVTAGNFYSCALTSAGGVKCWGANWYGQLGNGVSAWSPPSPPDPPFDVSGLGSGVSAISAGPYVVCALLAIGRAKCWGNNDYGQLGDGSMSQSGPITLRSTPATVLDYLFQTITFPSLPNRDVAEGSFTVPVSASSGLPVPLYVWPGSVCVVSGSTITLVGPGICNVVASQQGSADYYRAEPVTRQFLIRDAAAPATPRLGNISTRVRVAATANSMPIGGFIIGGNKLKTVLVRARGPSLSAAGVSDALPNPKLRLVQSAGNTTVAVNDDWQGGPSADLIQSLGFAPANPLEAAVLVTLGPGAYTALVESADGSEGVSIVEVFGIDTPDAPLTNISTRGAVLTGENVMIGGFIIEGNGPQTVIVRARGPSLAQFGITNSLANPMLQVVRSSDQATLATNDDWATGPDAAQINAAGFAPANALESAVLLTLAPGAYTAIVTGANGGTGVGIMEVFRQ